MLKITPKPVVGKSSFRVTFRHPLEGNKPKTFGLGTDEIVASMVCKDVEAIANDAELLHNPEKHRVRLATSYEARAVEIVFGKRAVALLADAVKPGVLDVEEEKDLRARVLAKELYDVKSFDRVFAKMEAMAKAAGSREIGIPPPSDAKDTMAYVLEELQKITPKGIRRLQEDLSNALKRIQDLDSQNKAMRAELIELRKKANVTVTATIAEAIRGPATSKGRRRKDWLNEEPQGFEQFYRAGRSESHYRWVGKVLWNFTSALRRKGETPVGSVSAAEIDKWLATTRKADGAEHNPLTRRAYKNALSVFFRWASKAFGMGTNPMRDVDPVRGVVFENIVAIRQVSDLASLLKALEPWPYWQAWLAVATLAGPRYSEQARLKVSDVLLQEGHLRIRATKTGKQRMVPIEQSILDPILKQHLARRRRESSGGEFLFPALTGPGVHERKKSEPHRWSHNRCWHTYWSAAIAKAAELKNMTLAEAIKKKKLPEYWGYGPREWRHTFGTLLGLSGWNALEIARVMGNSPMVADQHYVAVSSKGKGSRLKLKW